MGNWDSHHPIRPPVHSYMIGGALLLPTIQVNHTLIRWRCGLRRWHGNYNRGVESYQQVG